MMEFGSPILLLLLLPLAALGWWILARAPLRNLGIRFPAVSLLAKIAPPRTGQLVRYLPILQLLAMACFILALARPRQGNVEQDIIREGVDIFYCLDISGSMLAEDFEPNRLEKAKMLTSEFAARRPNDRQGIVLFAGISVQLCPLTFDTNSIRAFLQAIKFGDISVDGTAIGMGLARCLKKLRGSTAKSKVIILMTDGVNNAGDIDPVQAAALAKKLGVRIHAIGIGSTGPVYVTLETPFGPQRQRLDDSLDEALLQKLAAETGGTYGRAANARELEAILKQIDLMEKTEIETTEYRSYVERLAWFAWPGLALLILHQVLAGTVLMKLP